MRQRQEEWSYVAPAPVLESTVDWHRTRSVGLQLQSCDGVPRRSPPKWRIVFNISTPFEGMREGVQYLGSG